jgi:hypothetical protein
MRTILLTCGLLLWLAPDGRAEEVSVRATVDRNSVVAGEAFNLTITVSGASGVPEPELPRQITRDFDLYSTGSSRNFSFSGGQVSTAIAFSYRLVALNEGTYTIPPISIRVDGDVLETQPIPVTVLRRGAAPPAPRPSGRSPKSREVFLKAEVSKTRPYEGEEIVLSVRFYRSVDLFDRPQYDAPSTGGFLAERLPDGAPREEEIDGVLYGVQELRYALFPLGAGEKVIGPARITATLAGGLGPRDPFSIFGRFSEGRTVVVETEPVRVDVRPLPKTDDPSFSGAIGTFHLKAEIDRSEVAQNDPVTLTVEVSGVGNIGSATGELTASALDGFRVFDASSEVESQAVDGMLGGVRRIKRAFVPLVPGKRELPEVRFTYFDPNADQYRTLTAGPFPVTVVAASGAGSASAPLVIGKDEVKLLEEDIRFIHTDPPSFRRMGHRGVPASTFLHFLPAALVVGAWFRRRHERRVASDPAYVRARRAATRARRLLADAEQGGGDLDAAVWSAVGGYVADRWNAPSAAPTALEAEDLLRRGGVSETLVRRIRELGERCDFERFGPGRDAARANALLHDARALIADLERAGARGGKKDGER